MSVRSRVIIGLIAGITIPVLISIAHDAFITPSQRSNELPPQENVPREERVAYWEARIKAVGGPAAYQELATYMTGFNPLGQHAEGHVFGDALYRVEGIAGITTCDDRFAYACFHALAIRGIEQEGPAFSHKMHKECGKQTGMSVYDCQHGIGHGLLGTTGYDPESLDQALALCAALSPSSPPLRGCAGGVFMEYGIRAMETEGQVVARPFSETEVFEPCARLDPYVRPSCAYWQPMWWTASHPERDNGREMAQLMKEWCDEFPGGETTRLACLAGSVNRIQLLTDEDPSRVGTICGILAADDTSRYLCHVFSAVRFAHYYPLEYAEKACAHLPLEAEISCRERSTDLTLARRTDLQLYNELLSTALSWGKAD